jgi:hypothetical protein
VFSHPQSARARRRLTGAFLAALLAAPAQACPLALALALDVSASIDRDEYALQQNGVAAALTDPSVEKAIVAQGGIWLTAFEWSGAHHQYDQLAWTFVDSPAAIERAAASLRHARRRVSEFPTSLGYGLGYALIRLSEAPELCARRVIDVASDGVNNDGFPPASAYRANDMSGITVNALVIEDGDPTTTTYYRDNVIRGLGAFVERAATYADYADAMQRKLLREIGAMSLVSAE